MDPKPRLGIFREKCPEVSATNTRRRHFRAQQDVVTVVVLRVVRARRDFANGFLLAEIFSRYDDKNVQMHSYDNGTSLAVRKDNWNQLKKYWRKRGFEYSQEEIDSVIHSAPGAAVPFINKVYKFLTGRLCVFGAIVRNDCFVRHF